MSLMDMVRGTGRAAEGGKVGDMAAGVAEDRDKAAVGTVGAVGKGILHIPGHNSPFLFLFRKYKSKCRTAKEIYENCSSLRSQRVIQLVKNFLVIFLKFGKDAVILNLAKQPGL